MNCFAQSATAEQSTFILSVKIGEYGIKKFWAVCKRNALMGLSQGSVTL